MLEIISNAPFGVYILGSPGLVSIFSRSDGYVHPQYVHHPDIHIPIQCSSRFLTVNLIRIKYQKLQYIKFFGSQVYFSLPAIMTRLPSQSIVRSPCLNALCLFFLLFSSVRRMIALIRALTSRNVKRFGDIIIRTIFKTKDLIHILALSSQHHNRHIGNSRICWQTSKPVHLRSIRSRRIISYFFFLLYASSIISAVNSIPSCSRLKRIPLRSVSHHLLPIPLLLFCSFLSFYLLAVIVILSFIFPNTASLIPG